MLLLLPLLLLAAAADTRFAVQLDLSKTSIEEFCRMHDVTLDRRVGNLKDVFVVVSHSKKTRRRHVSKEQLMQRMQSTRGVAFVDEQIPRQQSKRAKKTRKAISPPTDPLYSQQWHLPLIKAPEAWQLTRGEGAAVQIIDDGCQWQHADLREQYDPSLSHNFNEGDKTDPSPNPQYDYHGTSCSGVAVARDNSVCGVGAAYRARLGGVRLISGPTDDATEAEGITVNLQAPAVVRSCSWGPTDDGKRLEGPGRVTLMAMEQAVQEGRGGKGAIWMWAGGNGGDVLDDCNYDGYANSPMTIAIGAISDHKKQSYYSEPCAALIVGAPSSGGDLGITTTDLMGQPGYSNGDCTDDFGGTSSAAPLAAGVVGLMLSANPNLGWKDVQYILMTTAFQVDPTDADWVTNGVGRKVNHKYGYGMIDAHAAVVAAKGYTKYLNSSISRYAMPKKIVNVPIPQYDPTTPTSVSSTIVVPENVGFTLQHVQVYFDASHPKATELDVVLTSPMGTKSQLAAMRGFQTLTRFMITNPVGIAGEKSATLATWSKVPRSILSASFKQFPGTACSGSLPPLTNDYEGHFVLVPRGVCSFTEKAVNILRYKPAAIIIYNNVGGGPIQMAGDLTNMTVPVLMISLETADSIKAQSSEVTASLESVVIKDETILRYSDWGFTSNRLWGEKASGTWTLTVSDHFGSGASEGDFKSWTLVLWNDRVNSGEAPVPSAAPAWWKNLDTRAYVLAVVIILLVLALVAVLLFMYIKKKGLFRPRHQFVATSVDSGLEITDDLEQDIWDDNDLMNKTDGI